MQDKGQNVPMFLNLNSSYDKLKEDESSFIKDLGWDINGNPKLSNGTDNPTGEGQNEFILTPARSNVQLPNVITPAGYNKNIGTFESIMTGELYYFNYNSNGNHGIYVISNNNLQWTKIVEDPLLGFSDEQANFIAPHRVRIRVVYDKNKNIVEKILLLTDGNGWQKWINTIAAINTNGFNVSAYPYFNTVPPHFDRRELFEWATRKAMYNPTFELIPNDSTVTSQTNYLLNKAIQVSYKLNYTDGRTTDFAPYSEPIIVEEVSYIGDYSAYPKRALIKLYAGNCMVESIDIFIRFINGDLATKNTIPWSDWFKYERIYKYGVNPTVLETPYWLRTNQWSNYSYDSVFNTIEYVFDNSRLADIYPQDDANRIQNDLPITSVGLTDLGDAVLLSSNKYFYDNLPKSTLQNLDAVIVEKNITSCNKATRNLSLYAYMGLQGEGFQYISQVGYYLGNDTQMRFGGLYGDTATSAKVDSGESKLFKLDFADKTSHVCYLKGTPYYAIGQYYEVDSNNNLTKIPALLDATNADTLVYIKTVWDSGGYFVVKFDFIDIPEGKYIATLGRHNVNIEENYRDQSTYIMGIANSQIKTQIGEYTSITPSSFVSTNKEIAVDLTTGDVDVWGNGADLFYIFVPYTEALRYSFRFIEGYLREDPSTELPFEYVPYTSNGINIDATGTFTDKNGFYFVFSKANHNDTMNVVMDGKFNCVNTSFQINTSGSGSGYKQNAPAYWSNHNTVAIGTVGENNRVHYKGKIASLDGSLNYANVAISIFGGNTVYSKSDGTFELIIHNAKSTLRTDYVYVNAGGDFQIYLANCADVPLFYFNEALVPCGTLTTVDPCTGATVVAGRYYACLNLSVQAQGQTYTSVKQNSSFSIGFSYADLAGRLQYVNEIKNLLSQSFDSRGDTLPTFIRLLKLGALNLPSDAAWVAPYVANNSGILTYLQWVGDTIKYVDNNGTVVNDAASAVMCSIDIDSFYNNNIAKNLSLLANYQFKQGDRLRIYDDGKGNLLSTPIDIEILGSNYNQAAINANLIAGNGTTNITNVNVSNTVNTTTASTSSATAYATNANAQSITLYVKYIQQLDVLLNNNGFWIEIYTPNQNPEILPYNELTWYPVINGEIAIFDGYIGSVPQYIFPTSIDLNYWDTYLIRRSIQIPNVGNRYFNHPFESPNITDNWGKDITSGGRKWIKNDDAKQTWFGSDNIKSDNFINNGLLNGLGTFRSSNRKDFSNYPFGSIVAVHTEMSIILFICENGWFTTDYNYHFTYANEQGVMVTNLDNGLSQPHQKIGDNYGCALEYTSTIGFYDKMIWWYDIKNQSLVISDYRSVLDITKVNMDSYFNAKSKFISEWNAVKATPSKFDIVTGIDMERNNLYVTFRPRRNNSNDLSSYINDRRNVQVNFQETLVYNITYKRWTRFSGFTPESYASLRGVNNGVEMITFSAGKPYYHNNTPNYNFLNFYGQDVNKVFICIFNKNAGLEKILQSISLDCNDGDWFVETIISDKHKCFSFVPLNYFVKKEGIRYAPVLRDMNSYPPLSMEELFRSMLFDGKKIDGCYFVVKFVGDINNKNKYSQLKAVYYKFTSAANTQ